MDGSILPGLLPDHEIERLGFIHPFSKGEKRPGKISWGVSSYGYDCRVGRNFKIFTNTFCTTVDPKKFDLGSFQDHTGDYCLIPPNSFVLAESLEFFDIPRDVLAICLGKSTYARTGILINCTPLEPRWRGKITIEISNTTPLPAKIYAEEGIMQILFFRAASECLVSYADKKGIYMDQEGITLPKCV